MSNVTGDSNVATIPAVNGTNTSTQGTGVEGEAALFGVVGESTPDPVSGLNAGTGVEGRGDTGPGVVGRSNSGPGIHGFSQSGFGIHGESAFGPGVFGNSPKNFPGVQGASEENHGVHGSSTSGRGVFGISQSFFGVSGQSKSSVAVIGESDTNDGVFGVSTNGIGIHGKGGHLAGFFEGNVVVTGDIRFGNADCAEDFNIAGSELAEPGTVMVLNDGGELAASAQAYDKRVAGVVCGAGAYKPGIVLDRRDTAALRQPIGLLGKVFCKVDAQFSAIAVGDLLTTSPTPGHAMATNDPIRSFGAVIGKALRPLAEGQGLIPILIALQ